MNPALRRSAAHVFVDSLVDPQLDDADLHHLGRVLRLRTGEAVSASDGAGAWRSCRFVDGGRLEPDADIVVEVAAASPLTVGFAIPKVDRPEWIVQKLTEIGIDRIVVLHADRSVSRWDGERVERHLTKLRKVAREASMQSRRVVLPRLDGPVRPADIAVTTGLALAEPGGVELATEHTTMLIGPEGGWTPNELEAVPTHVDLGASILRVETAALVAAARMVALR